MSIGSSPSIVSNGLVFNYDMNNNKSYRSPPLTNVLSQLTQITGSNAYFSFTSGTENVYIPTVGLINNCKYVDMYNDYNGGSGNCCPNPFSYGSGLPVSPSTVYTYAILYKSVNRYTHPNYMYHYEYNSGGTYLTEFGAHMVGGYSGQETHLGDDWYWSRALFTTQSTAATVNAACFMYEYARYNRLYIAKVMLVPGDYTNLHPNFWPAVGTTVSNTQSLLDLTNNNTITASSLTYASNGNFSFNGSSAFISVANSSSLQFADTFTINVWINPTSLSTRCGIFSTRTINTTGCWQLEVGIANSGQRRIAVTGVGTWIWESANDVISTNTWWNICFVKSSNSVQGGSMYLNGNLLTPTTTTAYTISNNNDNKVIGQGTNGSQFFSGRISSINLYNRALTAAEVQQNFNAQKEIYFGYQNLTLINSSNITLARNGTQSVTITKNADNNSWNGQAYSTEAFTAPCTIEFTKNAASGDNSVSYAMIGWNTDPTTDSSYSSIDHASYPYQQNDYVIYHNGNGQSELGTWSASNRFYVVYDTDGFIRHYNGSKLLYSANYGTGNTVYLDTSLYNTDTTFCKFENVMVCRRSWNGNQYV
jgi:hypothetical protein